MKDTNLTRQDVQALRTHVKAIINILERLDDVGYEMVNDFSLNSDTGRYKDMQDYLQYLYSVRI